MSDEQSRIEAILAEHELKLCVFISDIGTCAAPECDWRKGSMRNGEVAAAHRAHVASLIAAQPSVAEEERETREPFGPSEYVGFRGCTDRNPDLCACGDDSGDPTCLACGEEIADGEMVFSAQVPLALYLDLDDPDQEWELQTWHARCDGRHAARPSVAAPAPTDWHDPEARAAAGMGPDHDRKVIEGVQEHGWQAVVVRCPHVVGLCYDDTDNGMLANLPCPCNDRSEVVGRLVLVGADEAVTPQPDSSGLAPAPEEEGSRRSTALRPRCSASTTTRSRCPRGSAPSRRSRRPNVAEQPTDWIKDAGWFDGLMHEAQQGNRAEFDAMLRRLLSEHARAIAAPVPVPEDEQRGCICGHEDSAHDADGCRTCQGRSEDEQRETLAEVEAFERQQLQVREVAELGEVIRGLNDHIAELLGIDPTDPMAIAAHVLGSTWLCNDRARVWDEAAEATADWMANNPSPSGIPVDPPRNPYKAGDPRGE